MATIFRAVGAALVVLTCAAIARADTEADIRKAGEAFSKAIAAGDGKAAKEHAVTDDKSALMLDAFAKLSTARKHLTEAAVEKFGDEGKTIAPPTGRGPGGATELQHNFQNAKIEVDGDTATVVGARGGQPVKFKKEGGDWKIDLTKLPNIDRIERGLPIMEKMAGVMDETTADIKDGKLKSAAEAKQELHQKIVAAVGGSRGGAPPRGAGSGNQ